MEITNPEKNYSHEHSIVYSCQYHVLFCPKYRRAVLTDQIAERLDALLLEKQAEYGYEILDRDVLPDHVHLLLSVDPRIGVNKVVSQIKGYTAHTLRKEFPQLKSRLPSLWTRSKFISSVGAVTLEVVKQYLTDQKGV
ncbi:MAG: IS200/IS605 family transposase [Candidatus Bipolaricaulia bacterium]